MKPVAVTLPLQTVSEANSHEHWRRRHVRAGQQRYVTALALARPTVAAGIVSEAKLRRELRAPVLVLVTRVAPSNGLDDDNLPTSCKHVRDGVADALGIDDRDPRVRWRYAQRRGPYAVEIRIEPMQRRARATRAT